MKNVIITILLLFSVSLSAQDHIVMYSGGLQSYLGAGYMRLGQGFALGINLHSTVGTWMVDHQNAYEMDESSILDGGEHSWQYNGERLFDRGSITGRLYLQIKELDYSAHWVYVGIGPGWARSYYGYDRSGSDNTEYVLNREGSVNATELEIGFSNISGDLMWGLGLSAVLKSIASTQLTFALGFPLN